MCGFIHADVEDYAFDDDFTIALWALSGTQGTSACAVSVESPGYHENLVRIGENLKEGYFKVSCRTGAPAVVWHHIDSRTLGKFQTERWYHLVLVRAGDKLQLYVDGNHASNPNGEHAPSLFKARKVRV